MTQVARRASVALALLLLTSVGMASGECAWVLWVHFTPIDSDSSSGKSARHGRRRPSARPPARRNKKRVAGTTPRAYLMGDTVFIPSQGRLAAWEAICLPDTVDPRAPKGK
jgi:hypothetical protein